ncbi:MAG: 50S ribosomal protein L29 [Bdellovibrionales bacterium]|nr:50S ribosomal protein L29 [Bdellovibrionales bacterium]
MKYNEIKDLTVDELRKRHQQLKSEIFELKMKHSMGQVANPVEIRYKRRDMARILTAVNAKLAQ